MRSRHVALVGLAFLGLVSAAALALLVRPAMVSSSDTDGGDEFATATDASVQAPIELELDRGARTPRVAARIASTVAAPTPRSRPAPPAFLVPTCQESELWDAETVGKSAADVQELARSIEATMNQAAALALRDRQEAGRYEDVVGYGTRLEHTQELRAAEQGRFVAYSIPPAGLEAPSPQRTIVLPEFEFPELYSQKRHVAWLREREAELRAR
ncbi:MAG: hypothetical protein U1F29_17550 [Planctomycetota bacterium]